MPTSNDIYKTIADPTRRAILDVLRVKELTVSEICQNFDVTQGAISQHLKILRDAQLVIATKSGRLRTYRANPAPLIEVFQWVLHYHEFWPKKMDGLEKYLAKQSKSKRK